MSLRLEYVLTEGWHLRDLRFDEMFRPEGSTEVEASGVRPGADTRLWLNPERAASSAVGPL